MFLYNIKPQINDMQSATSILEKNITNFGM